MFEGVMVIWDPSREIKAGPESFDARGSAKGVKRLCFSFNLTI